METVEPRYADVVASLPEHLGEFLGLSRGAVLAHMQTARAERNRRWSAVSPRTAAERERLYAELGELDLLKSAVWHRADRVKQALHDALLARLARPGLCVIDVGGGIGDTALLFALAGCRVLHVELPGPCADFARFRADRLGCRARIGFARPEAVPALEPGRFDLAASIDVLEHLDDPLRHARGLARLLAPGGVLFVTAHFRHSERNPDHLPANDRFYRRFGGEPGTRPRSALERLGLVRRSWWWYERAAAAPLDPLPARPRRRALASPAGRAAVAGVAFTGD